MTLWVYKKIRILEVEKKKKRIHLQNFLLVCSLILFEWNMNSMHCIIIIFIYFISYLEAMWIIFHISIDSNYLITRSYIEKIFITRSYEKYV